MKKLIDILNSHYPLSDKLQKETLAAVRTIDIKKRQRLIRPGQLCDHIYFIERGLFRGSCIQNSREECIWFMKEGNLMTSVISYYRQIPSAESIYAMEDSRLYSIRKEQLDRLHRDYTELNFASRLLTEEYYVLAGERELLLRIKRAADKYERFLELYPGLADRIPGKYIASFLSITLETLSRTKSKRRNRFRNL